MLTYAADTSVSVEKSRAEIETTLSKYGATRFGYMMSEHGATIVFEANKKAVKFVLPLPDRAAFSTKKRYGKTVPLDPASQHREWEQACRSRWRSLSLCIRAKLEAVSAGITTFEIEFLAHFVTPGGKTIGDRIVPQLEEMASSGKIPRLELMA